MGLAGSILWRVMVVLLAIYVLVSLAVVIL